MSTPLFFFFLKKNLQTSIFSTSWFVLNPEKEGGSHGYNISKVGKRDHPGGLCSHEEGC